MSDSQRDYPLSAIIVSWQYALTSAWVSIADNAVNVLEVFLEFENHKSSHDAEFIEQLEINLAKARTLIAAAQETTQ